MMIFNMSTKFSQKFVFTMLLRIINGETDLRVRYYLGCPCGWSFTQFCHLAWVLTVQCFSFFFKVI